MRSFQARVLRAASARKNQRFFVPQNDSFGDAPVRCSLYFFDAITLTLPPISSLLPFPLVRLFFSAWVRQRANDRHSEHPAEQ